MEAGGRPGGADAAVGAFRAARSVLDLAVSDGFRAPSAAPSLGPPARRGRDRRPGAAALQVPAAGEGDVAGMLAGLWPLGGHKCLIIPDTRGVVAAGRSQVPDHPGCSRGCGRWAVTSA